MADANADDPKYRLQLAELLVDRGTQYFHRRKFLEAEDAFRQGLKEYDLLCRSDSSAKNLFRRAKAQSNLAGVLLVAGRIGLALPEVDKAVDLLTSVVRTYPNNPEHVQELGQAIYNAGTARLAERRRGKGEK